jgi:hypothetical protein
MATNEHAKIVKRIHLEAGDTFTLGALAVHDAPSPALSEHVYFSNQLHRVAKEAMSGPDVLTDAEAAQAIAAFTALLGIVSEGLTAISRTAQQLSTYFAAAQAASTQKA